MAESWRAAFRTRLAPLLDEAALEALRAVLTADDVWLVNDLGPHLLGEVLRALAQRLRTCPRCGGSGTLRVGLTLLECPCRKEVLRAGPGDTGGTAGAGPAETAAAAEVAETGGTEAAPAG